MGIISPEGELCFLGFAHKGASAPRSRTDVLIPSLGHLIPLRGIVEVWGLSRRKASSAFLASPTRALPRRAVELTFSSPA